MVAVLLAAGAHVGERPHDGGIVGRDAHPHGPAQHRVVLQRRSGSPGIPPPRPLRHGRHHPVQLGLLRGGSGGNRRRRRGDPFGGRGRIGGGQEERRVGRHYGRRRLGSLAQRRQRADEEEGTVARPSRCAAAATLGHRLALIQSIGQVRHNLANDPSEGPVVLGAQFVAHSGVEAGPGPGDGEGDGMGRVDAGRLERRGQLPGPVGAGLEQVRLEEGRGGVAHALRLDLGREGRQFVVVGTEDVGIGAAGALRLLLLPPFPSLPNVADLLGRPDVALAQIGHGAGLLRGDGAEESRAGGGEGEAGGQYLRDGRYADAAAAGGGGRAIGGVDDGGVDGDARSVLRGGAGIAGIRCQGDGEGPADQQFLLPLELALQVGRGRRRPGRLLRLGPLRHRLVDVHHAVRLGGVG